jgi:prepilin-type N-terminal cleavage/methylation domain-containing protein
LYSGRRAAARGAFTLVELLVVVTILALLISILMPSLKQARVQTKRTACASNLRQIGIGLQSYLVDSNDRLPHASYLPSTSAFPLFDVEPIFIADVLAPYLDDQRQVFECPDDRPDDRRAPPFTGMSFFQSDLSSYQYRWWPPWSYPGGKTIAEVAARCEEHWQRPVPENTIWLLSDYKPFHGQAGKAGAKRYLYIDGHVTDYEN